MRIPGADKAINHLMKWSVNDTWRPMLEQIVAEHLEDICDEYGMDEQGLTDTLGDSFGMVYGWILEDFFTIEFDDELNIIDDFLKRRGWREKAPAKRYLSALRDSVCSLYEVVDVEPGHSITVRDVVVGGDAVEVSEVSGSQSVHKWDHLAARRITVNNKACFTGALLPFSREAADIFLDEIDRATKKLGKSLRKVAKENDEPMEATDEDLKKFILETSSYLISQIWLGTTLERMMAPLPDLRNTDGQEILFSEVSFPIHGNASELVPLIDGIEGFVREDPDEDFWTWVEGAARPTQATGGESLMYMSRDLSGNTILGKLEITDDRLVLATNSRERAEQGRDILIDHLGDRVGQPLTAFQTPEQKQNDPDRQPVEQAELPPDVAGQVLQEFFDEHYRKTLDQAVPALGGKTPRQAAKSKKGREKVVAWLKLLENTEARRARSQGGQPYDSRWMWKELKVDDQR